METAVRAAHRYLLCLGSRSQETDELVLDTLLRLHQHLASEATQL